VPLRGCGLQANPGQGEPLWGDPPQPQL